MTRAKQLLLLLAGAFLFIGGGEALAVDGHMDAGQIGAANYYQVAGSTAAHVTTPGTVQAFGYGTDYEFRVYGSSDSRVTLSFNFLKNKNSVDTTSMTINGGQYSYAEFKVPASSPTIMTYSLPGGVTFQYRIGILKTDQ